MSTGYKIIMKGCGAVAAGAALVYLAVIIIALGDGIGVGIEIPKEINVVAIAVILLGATLAGDAWIADRSARQSAQRDVRPIIQAEVEQAVSAIVPELAAVVAGRVSVKSAAAMREFALGELAELVNAAVSRAHRAGMIQQAQINGSVGVAKVVKLHQSAED